MVRFPALLLALAYLSGTVSAQLNNPYPAAENGEAIFYSSFSERPKYLDPARSYSSDEYEFICQIYEPVVQYHYLRRPYALDPLTAAEMPGFRYLDKDGNVLPADAPVEAVAQAVWSIRIKPGILYQEHPCFAKDDQGRSRYLALTEMDCRGIKTLFDFKQTGTRELTARDYMLQIMRLADERLECPVFAPVVAEYIVGMKEYAQALNAWIEAERTRRREARGMFYNREEDEKADPIRPDYFSIPCPGLRLVDDHTFEIVLNKKYPQFVYWLAMPFFAPMPEEALAFYGQGVMIERNIVLDWYPVGSGAYRMAMYDPDWRIMLAANEHYRDERYPSEGAPGDREAGILASADRRLPLIPRAVFSVERESAPGWRKFMQGYYDFAGVSSEQFSKVMDLSVKDARLSEEMERLGIRLNTAVIPSVYGYFGFNMDDPVVGGLEEKRCKLRQALTIALNREEFIEIFLNGRGLPAMGPIPPGIFGYLEGEEGMNPVTHTWGMAAGQAVRRSVDEARRLLAEAGYPGGISAETGQPLVVYFDTASSNVDFMNWLKKQFKALNVTIEMRQTDYNRFREKMDTGNYQIFSWGWNADYPDPENFLFLLYGPNGKVKYKGENGANYTNPEFDRLFERMKTLENSPARLAIIREMLVLARHDAPWEFGYYPKAFSLAHAWMGAAKPNLMANNLLKYRSLDLPARNRYRAEHNAPRWGWVAAAAAVVILVILPGLYMVLRREFKA
ncbi:MAG: ABC transporter substrate-binding protein [Planctomycetota bacterium]